MLQTQDPRKPFDKDKVKRNVDRMASMGATADEIERYIQSEGGTEVAAAPAAESTPNPNEFSDLERQVVGLPPKPDVGMVEGVANAGMQGLTLGLSDELSAALSVPRNMALGDVGPVEAYKRERDAIRNRQRAFSDDHGIAAGASELAGSIPAALATGPQGAIRAATKFGAAAGFGHAEGDDVASQAKGTGIGAALGLGLGAAGSAVAKPITALGSALLTRSGMRPTESMLGGRIRGTKDMAKKFVQRMFNRDQLSEAEVQGRALAPGTFTKTSAETPEIVADLGGENVKRGLSGLQGMPGKTAGAARETLDNRTAQQFPRITEDVRKILHVTDDDATRVGQELVESRKATFKPAYEQLYAKGDVADDGIDALLKNRWFRKAFTKAKGIAADEGIKLKEIYKIVGTKEIVTAVGKKTVPILERHEIPNVETLDYMRRQLNRYIKKYYRAGDGEQAQAIQKLRDRLDARLDELVPEYRALRQQYQGDLAAKEALDSGINIFKPTKRLTSDEVSMMSESERDLYLIGAFKALRDKMRPASRSKLGSAPRDLTKLLNDDVLEQLQTASRSPQEFDELMKLLHSEAGMAETASKMHGSRSMPLGQVMAEVEGIQPDIISAAGRVVSSPLNPRAWVDLLRSPSSQNVVAPASGVADQAGDMLLGKATPQNISNIFTPTSTPSPLTARMGGALMGQLGAPQLSGDAKQAQGQALMLRSQGMSDQDLEQQLSQLYTPEVVKFIVAATPQRLPQ